MATASEIVAAIDAHVKTRIESGALDSYMIAGDDISMMSGTELAKLRSMYVELAKTEASGKPRRPVLAKLSPFR